MRHIYLIFLLFTSSLFSQEYQPDLVNAELIKYIKSVDVQTNSVKDLLIEKVEGILLSTVDTVVIKDARSYLQILKNKNLSNSRNVNTDNIVYDKKKFNVRKDKFTGNVFIKHKNFSNIGIIQVYIAIIKNEAYLRVVTSYKGQGWIFMDKASLLIHGKKYDYHLTEVEREVSSGAYVSEVSDQIANEDLYNIINFLSNCDEDVDVRLSGDKYDDRKLKQKYIETIRETLELYKTL